jgi:hypothetical protein
MGAQIGPAGAALEANHRLPTNPGMFSEFPPGPIQAWRGHLWIGLAVIRVSGTPNLRHGGRTRRPGAAGSIAARWVYLISPSGATKPPAANRGGKVRDQRGHVTSSGRLAGGPPRAERLMPKPSAAALRWRRRRSCALNHDVGAKRLVRGHARRDRGALTGWTVAQIQMPAQASAAFQQRQLSEASRNLDADTIALFSEHLTRGTRYVPTPCQPHRDPRGAAAR